LFVLLVVGGGRDSFEKEERNSPVMRLQMIIKDVLGKERSALQAWKGEKKIDKAKETRKTHFREGKKKMTG